VAPRPPRPLTRPGGVRLTAWGQDRGLVLGLTLLSVIARALAIPASLWEWDDVLFARALHHFDITAHTPHPPGFPVFVMLGRAAYAVTRDERLAYAVVACLFGALLSASLFYFYREIFQDSAVAVAGALLGSFAPNVLVYAGAPRSDGPALTLEIIGLALAVRGLRSRRALLGAAVLLGLSIGVRVTLLTAVGPALAVVLFVRARARQWRLVAGALTVLAAGVVSWYVPLVLHTGWSAYRSAVAHHAHYTLITDSIFAANANALLPYRLHRFFVDIWGTSWIVWTVYVCSAVGVLLLALRRQWGTVGWLALCFLPTMAFTLVINTALSAPLYSLSYVPLFAGLAGFALVEVPSRVFHHERRPALAHVGLLLAGAVSIGFVGWTSPIIGMIRSEESPPVRALHYLRRALDPDRDVLYYDRLYLPHVMFYLPGFRRAHEGLVAEADLIDPAPLDGRRRYTLTPEPPLAGRAQDFHWFSRPGARRLTPLSLGRYFDVYVAGPVEVYPVTFLSGWYQQEGWKGETWRWMGGESKTALYVASDAMRLHVRASMPRGDAISTVILRLDGAVLDRVAPVGDTIDRVWTVRPDRGRLWSILTIETDHTFVPSRNGRSADSRVLGLQCRELSWAPAPGSTPTVTSREQFLGPGWFPLENDHGNAWRSTTHRAVVNLPPIAGDGRLAIGLQAGERSGDGPSTVTVAVGGQVLERFPAPVETLVKTYRIPASLQRDTPAELTLSVEPLTTDDQRRLRVSTLGWGPAADP
jgi:hypothetical protein